MTSADPLTGTVGDCWRQVLEGMTQPGGPALSMAVSVYMTPAIEAGFYQSLGGFCLNSCHC